MRQLALGVALAVCLLASFARPSLAAGLPEPLFGTATGDIDDPGALLPLGNGRFSTQDRVYVGRLVGRSVVDEVAACFNGSLRSGEDWLLEAPRMVGSHQSTVTIRSDRGMAILSLRGSMEFPTASGTWSFLRGTGPCASLDGSGRYSATYSNVPPEMRLTFEGTIRG